jgi:7-cyano-7-deazaguanine synthase
MTVAVCLVSGGLDSCVAAAIAAQSSMELAFLHVSYGQRTQERERRAFHAIADHFNVSRRLVVDISYLREIGGSALTDPSIPVPEGQADRPGIPISYVPFRNANLLAIATSWAEVLNANKIYIGAVEEDSSGYPDCRKVFFDAFNEAIRRGTRPGSRIEIVTPLVELNKAEIVCRGLEMGAPIRLTWSCYQSEEMACGRCDSCLLRLQGFANAGFEDPILYAAQPDKGPMDGSR